jgi:hypothetical protein
MALSHQRATHASPEQRLAAACALLLSQNGGSGKQAKRDELRHDASASDLLPGRDIVDQVIDHLQLKPGSGAGNG